MRAIAVSDVPKERKSDRHQDALLDADRNHCRGSEDGKIELARAFVEDCAQTLHVDHPDRDCKHDARQYAARQVMQRAG